LCFLKCKQRIVDAYGGDMTDGPESY
jgi:hypothetical protein